MMENMVITKRILCRMAADHWKDTYCDNPVYGLWRKTINGDSEAIYKKLYALLDPTEESIAAIIGNSSWTRLQCDVCKQDCQAIYCFPTAFYVCEACLSGSLEVLRKVTNEDVSTASEAVRDDGNRSGV